jgi:hypothetical protein
MTFRFFALLGAGLLLARCAPTAAPPPPAAAAPKCNCTVSSIMFFDPGESTLSAKNLAGVKSDAELYARQPPGPITVTGGADAQEAASDPDIARQRAEAVAAQLIADGVPAGAITIQDDGTALPADLAGQLAGRLGKHYVITKFDAPNLHTATAPAPVPAAAGPYQVKSIVLYEKPSVLEARLGSDPSPFRAYIVHLNAALAPMFAAAAPEPGLDGAIVIGLKPNGDTRSWLVDNPGSLSPDLAAQIQTAVQAVPPPPVQRGPLAFAIEFIAWGGGAPITNAAHPVPYPADWGPAPSTGIDQMPDIVFNRIWP